MQQNQIFLSLGQVHIKIDYFFIYVTTYCVVVVDSFDFFFHIKVVWVVVVQSELPQPIPRNSVESDNGCTSRIYFDNADDNVMLTLYNVTLTSQKPC